LWESWLWELDATADVNAKLPLNHSHLVGLVLCRSLAAQLRVCGQAALGQRAPRLSAAQWATPVRAVVGAEHSLDAARPYNELAMKAHHEQVTHAQVRIAAMLCELPAATVAQHLAALFAQAGALLAAGGHCGGQAGGGAAAGGGARALLDDPDGLDTLTFTQNGKSASSPCWTHARIRHQLDVFLVLFRAARIVELAAPPPRGLPLHELHEFHKEAGMDRFHELGMRYDLPPGAVLSYMHLFSGMFNSVSQVVFYNYPDYVRRVQIDIDELNKGDQPIYALPPLLELEPTTPVFYEEAPLSPAPGHALTTPATDDFSGWRLYLVAGLLFLLTPCGKVWHDANVKVLMAPVAAARLAAARRSGQGAA
jgi:hypothetical protein